VGSNPTPRTNEELHEVSNLVIVEIWILQRRNRESTIEQFVFVKVPLFFQNVLWLSVPGTRLVFMGYCGSFLIIVGVTRAI